MSAYYFVDWSDPAYPKVLPIKFDLTGRVKPLTFVEAKQEIIDHFVNERNFANLMIRQTRALRVRDLTP